MAVPPPRVFYHQLTELEAQKRWNDAMATELRRESAADLDIIDKLSARLNKLWREHGMTPLSRKLTLDDPPTSLAPHVPHPATFPSRAGSPVHTDSEEEDEENDDDEPELFRGGWVRMREEYEARAKKALARADKAKDDGDWQKEIVELVEARAFYWHRLEMEDGGNGKIIYKYWDLRDKWDEKRRMERKLENDKTLNQDQKNNLVAEIAKREKAVYAVDTEVWEAFLELNGMHWDQGRMAVPPPRDFYHQPTELEAQKCWNDAMATELRRKFAADLDIIDKLSSRLNKLWREHGMTPRPWPPPRSTTPKQWGRYPDRSHRARFKDFLIHSKSTRDERDHEHRVDVQRRQDRRVRGLPELPVPGESPEPWQGKTGEAREERELGGMSRRKRRMYFPSGRF
ncbi:hypothetical protein JCM8547_008614 [Rhodosporidiobolus lusitaniae]